MWSVRGTGRERGEERGGSQGDPQPRASASTWDGGLLRGEVLGGKRIPFGDQWRVLTQVNYHLGAVRRVEWGRGQVSAHLVQLGGVVSPAVCLEVGAVC